MIKATPARLDMSVQKERIIGAIKGALEGPTLIFVAGIHGNEPAGIFALREVLSNLQEHTTTFRGNLYAISGNLPALAKGIRYDACDLNRLWTEETIEKINDSETEEKTAELLQLKDIYQHITTILSTERGPFYFYDLHTTSSDSIPFITVNDSLLNRKYTSQYPLPLILGIEEFLTGALLSYINELGYIAFGFEGGQHEATSSIDAHIAFIYLSIVFSGCLEKSAIDFEKHHSYLFHRTQNLQAFYEIYKRYEIKPFEEFKMEPGFSNFQPIKKGMPLAKSNGKPIIATQRANIFMPLYQGKGNDGFFLVRKVPKVFLYISSVLRKVRFDNLLTLLPGVRWASTKKDELKVNLKIARFFTKNFFHLLGYRSRTISKTHVMVKNREAASRASEYIRS